MLTSHGARTVLSGSVFRDENLDGARNFGEVGLPGVTVHVIDSSGTPTSLVTDADGAWETEVEAGNVAMEIDRATIPAGHVLTSANDAQMVTVASGAAVQTVAVGYGLSAGSISGTVFMDLDGDPERDSYEPAFRGVTVALRDASGALVTAVDTDDTGAFVFADVPVGTFTVTVDGSDVGPAFVATVDPDGVADGSTEAVLGADEPVTGLDFGFAGTASIGDLVWVDADEDGEFDDSEQPLSGAVVSLWWAGSDGEFDTGDDYALGIEITDAAGSYLFAGLPDGAYRITVDAGGGGGMVATTPVEVVVTLGAGDNWVLGDFGFVVEEQLPFTGMDAEQLLLLAALMVGLAGLVLGDGRKRERRFTIDVDRLDR